MTNKFTQFQQKDVELLAENTAFDGFFSLKTLSLRHRLFKGGVSAVFERELCIRGDAVGVLLYDATVQKFALVEQLRIGALHRPQSPWLLEIVAGMLDKTGEDKEAVARRETLEEAGFEIEKIEPMLEYFCSPGGSTEFFSLFCAKVDLSAAVGGVFGVGDEHEDIRLHILTVAEVLEKLASGEINNAMTIIALQWFQLHREKIDQLWRKS